jgi:hypothetical protein
MDKDTCIHQKGLTRPIETRIHRAPSEGIGRYYFKGCIYQRMSFGLPGRWGEPEVEGYFEIVFL